MTTQTEKRMNYWMLGMGLALLVAAPVSLLAQQPDTTTAVVVPVPDFWDSIGNVVTAIGTLAGTLAVVIGAIVPLLKGKIKEKAKIVAASLKDTDFYMKDLAKEIHENKGRLEAIESALINLSGASDTDKAKLKEIKGKAIEIADKVSAEATKDTEELEKVHVALDEMINK